MRKLVEVGVRVLRHGRWFQGIGKRDCLCTSGDVRQYGCVETLSRHAAEGIVNIHIFSLIHQYCIRIYHCSAYRPMMPRERLARYPKKGHDSITST